MIHRLHSRLELPVSLDRVFPFFARAENLERITPPELDFHIITPRPITIEQGTLIDYRLRLFGVPFRWQSRISVWDPPHRFVDEQITGPYGRWVHTHEFQQTSRGTLILDDVEYSLPLFPVGQVAFPLVRLQLARVFAYRRRVVPGLIMS